MYHIAVPNPHMRKTMLYVNGRPRWYKKVGDGNEDRVDDDYHTTNPHHSAAMSHGQLPGIRKGGKTIRNRPGKVEEKASMSVFRKGDGKGKGKSKGKLIAL